MIYKLLGNHMSKRGCAMKRSRVFSCVVGMVSVMLFTPSVFAPAVPESARWHTGDIQACRSCGGSPESVRSAYGKVTLQKLSCLSLLDDMGNGEVVNLATDIPFVSTSAYVADVMRNSSQTGILVTLGSLLFVLGTVLRRNLAAPEEATSSHPITLPEDPLPMRTYIGAVDGVANTSASRRHANAV